MESKVAKVIIAAFMIMMSVIYVSNGQENKPPISEAERIVDKYSEKISSFFSEVADQAKIGAEYAFVKYAEFAVAKAVSDLSSSVLVVLLSLIGIKYSIIFCEKDDWSGESPPQYISLFVSILAFVVGSFFLVSSISYSLPIIISPEGYVINKLIESL